MARDRFYLNKHDAKLLGVCAGLADYLRVEALWVRVAVVMLTLLGHGITIPLYFVIAWLACRRGDDVAGRYDDDRALRRRARARMRTDLSDIDRRLADVESHYAGNARLADEIERLR